MDDDAPDAPRKVYVLPSVNKLGSIDAVAGRFRFDFYLYVCWRDDRFEAADNFPADDSIWWPRLEIMNKNSGTDSSWLCSRSLGAPSFLQVNYPSGQSLLTEDEINNGMWSQCQNRFQVFLDANLVLMEFPFDKQDAVITLESFLHQTTEMVIELVPGMTKGLIPAGSTPVSGWQIYDQFAYVKDHPYTMFGETYHSLFMGLRLARQPDYYLSRIVWGCVFLVAMAFLTLFIPGEEPDRLGFAQSSFLGIVSWQFIIVSITPITGYNTKLDNYIILSEVLVFGTYFFNAVRVSFFEWLDEKSPDHDHEVSETKEVGGDYSNPDEHVVPVAANKPNAILLKLFCGISSYHWWVDTAVGLLLSVFFSVATAGLLAHDDVTFRTAPPP